MTGDDDARSETTVLQSGEPKKATWIRRVLAFLALAVVLSLLIPYCMFRFTLNRRISQIERLGGTVSVGSNPLYYEFLFTTRYPEWLREVAKKPFGVWISKQFPTVYSVDFRGISDPDDVKAAIELAAGFNTDNFRGMTLYTSGVQDDHLEIVATSFPRLEQLKINNTAITDAGIEYLRSHRRLKQVNAQQTAITDASLDALASIRRLTELNIADTKITTVQPILDVHPGCRITQELVTRKNTTDRQRQKLKSP